MRNVPPPRAFKFFRFHAFSGKNSLSHLFTPLELAPPSRENPGSATGSILIKQVTNLDIMVTFSLVNLNIKTSMHSSRMHTARALTVFPGSLPPGGRGGGVCLNMYLGGPA